MENLGKLLAGMGLFFLGLSLIGENLKQLSGHKLRSWLGQVTGSLWRACAFGVVFGGIMQTTTGIVFLLSSLVTAGLVGAVDVLPVIVSANVGASLLGFAATINMDVVFLMLVGVAGICRAYITQPPGRTVASLVLGVGLLVYGVDLMQDGARPLTEVEQVQDALTYLSRSYPLAFLIGVVLSFVTQSKAAASLLAIALIDQNAGVLKVPETMMIIYGANLGSSLARRLLSHRMRGSALRLVAFQDAFCVLGSALFVVLFLLENVWHVPLVRWLVEQCSPLVEVQMALVFVLLNLVPAVLVLPLLRPIGALLAHYYPVSPIERAATPKHLSRPLLESAPSALEVILREQTRLIHRIAQYREVLALPDDEAHSNLDERHETYATLAREIAEYTADLAERPLDEDTVSKLTCIQREFLVIGHTEEAVRHFLALALKVRSDSPLKPTLNELTARLSGALDSAHQAASSLKPKQAHQLLVACKKQGELTEQVRQSQAAVISSLSEAQRTEVVQLLSTAEMVVWMLRKLAQVLQELSGEHHQDHET
jgi:phosphate:Na+ symporter